MIESIVVKTFKELEIIERERLLELTKEGPSVFRNWLTDKDQSNKYSSMIYLDNQIVGWAAAGPAVAAIQVGAYVDPEYQHRSFGTKVLMALMGHITGLKVGRYIQYEFGYRDFFQPVLDKYGFQFHSQQGKVVFAENIKDHKD
ncbi:GNAT family N-acetyltransferase [Candidatus Woesearchaeota archaeon]|nr:GNAT family N-acetyltransferase [Candidatus Woesearchaeota archaeon]